MRGSAKEVCARGGGDETFDPVRPAGDLVGVPSVTNESSCCFFSSSSPIFCSISSSSVTLSTSSGSQKSAHA